MKTEDKASVELMEWLSRELARAPDGNDYESAILFPKFHVPAVVPQSRSLSRATAEQKRAERELLIRAQLEEAVRAREGKILFLGSLSSQYSRHRFLCKSG